MIVQRVSQSPDGSFSGNLGMEIFDIKLKAKGEERRISCSATTGDYFLLSIGGEQYRVSYFSLAEEVLRYHESKSS